MNKNSIAFRMSISGILIAIATLFGSFSFPVLGAKVSPVQHFINIVTAVILGPVYACGNDFITSVLRNFLGTGSLLAFPGSMIGALLAGMLYKKFEKIELALLGEVIGTGIIGAIVAYPFAKILLGKEVAVFAYIIPFSISCIGGAYIAYIFLNIPQIKKAYLFL